MSYSPERIRERCREIASRPEPTEVSKGMRGAVIGRLNDAIYNARPFVNSDVGNNETVNMYRKLVQAWLFLDPAQVFLPLSSKLLTPPQWNALARWQCFFRQGEGYLERPSFREELGWILNRAIVDYDLTMQAGARGMPLLFEALLERWHSTLADAEALGGVVKPLPDPPLKDFFDEVTDSIK